MQRHRTGQYKLGLKLTKGCNNGGRTWWEDAETKGRTRRKDTNKTWRPLESNDETKRTLEGHVGRNEKQKIAIFYNYLDIKWWYAILFVFHGCGC
jgi:hypothetical protein